MEFTISTINIGALQTLRAVPLCPDESWTTGKCALEVIQLDV
jgi:hypothetical protein